jgi:MOSC N-terminal beta barrel domain
MTEAGEPSRPRPEEPVRAPKRWRDVQSLTRPRMESRMERQPIGVVHALYRYPVKSMQGERLRAVDIGPQGVIGDRAYALREANGRVMTAKTWPTLLECAARYEVPPTPEGLAPLCITLPDGRHLQAHDPDASAVLSTVLGCPVVLERAQADQHHRAAIDPATVFGDVPVETRLGGLGPTKEDKEESGTRDEPVPRDWRDVSLSTSLLLPGQWVSRKSSNARRVTMPRFALSPVWLSSRSI